MNKNKWFNEVFLPSLFERYGTNNGRWLTAKQTAICVDNFDDVKESRYISKNGDSYKSLIYLHKWNDREVILNYSKLNGCAIISFGNTPEEMEENRKSAEKRERERRIESLKRIRDKRNKDEKRKELYDKTIYKLKNDLEYYNDELQEAIDENNISDIEYYNLEIEKVKFELSILTSC